MLTSKDYCIFFSMEEDVNILYGVGIVLLLADGSFHNLYPVISNSPTLFH